MGSGSGASGWRAWVRPVARIIGGEGKGRRLKSPRGLATRPTGKTLDVTVCAFSKHDYEAYARELEELDVE